jgi:hypothetical protein
MNSVCLVQHLSRLPSGEEDVKLIGVYRTELGAREAVARLSLQPGFSNLPSIVDSTNDDDDQGFHISEYKLDEDHWVEGYVTMLGDPELLV